MIDWTTIIIAVLGLFTVGGAGVFFFYRANKGAATADAIQKAADAMQKMLENVGNQQDVFNKIIDQKNEMIDRLSGIISENEESIAENKRLIAEQSYHLATHARQLKGLQREIEKKVKAERLICFNEDCEIREPKLGTYKTDTHYVNCPECGKTNCENCQKEEVEPEKRSRR